MTHLHAAEPCDWNTAACNSTKRRSRLGVQRPRTTESGRLYYAVPRTALTVRHCDCSPHQHALRAVLCARGSHALRCGRGLQPRPARSCWSAAAPTASGSRARRRVVGVAKCFGMCLTHAVCVQTFGLRWLAAARRRLDMLRLMRWTAAHPSSLAARFSSMSLKPPTARRKASRSSGRHADATAACRSRLHHPAKQPRQPRRLARRAQLECFVRRHACGMGGDKQRVVRPPP